MAQIKILLVADAATASGVNTTLLGRKEFRIITTASAIDGYNLVKFEHPELAIIDIALPDVNGDELCRDIKSDPQTRKTVVAMLVDAHDDWFVERAKKAGAEHVMHKPIQKPEFDQVLAAVLKTPVRRSVRFPVRIMLEGSSTAGEMRGETVDMSISGIQFQMEQCDLENGYNVWLKFQPDAGSPAVVCKGTVVRVLHVAGGYRVGVKIAAYNGDGAEVVRRALARLHG